MRGCHPFMNKKWTLAEVMAFIKNKTNSELFKMQEQNIDECDVFSDTPIFVMAKMLRWRYPDARFVMTTRELDPWLDSTGRLMEYKCPRIAKGWKEFHRWYYGPGCHDDVVWRRRYVEHHVRMLKMFEGQLLLIPLEMPDDEKFKSLLTYLDCEAVEDTHYIFKQHALGQQTTAGGSGFDKIAP
ncbi:hypothetical protein CYMTET_5154 [Cymbomonas tetramitiformis]|uniref:Uncharacterized protein n=1 Tax=Cymbomonas tetramitiformis TaxID=36881 RepID=A0AAE0LJM8_9CHLO|nr:hypothetical protein CYMTET_5154 [Cymbomonas tetramitiformis]